MVERLAVFFDPSTLEHDTGQGFFEAPASPFLPVIETHPENSARVANMLGVLKQGPIAAALDWYQGNAADRADLERFHESAYIDELAAVPVTETRAFSGTTIFGPGSFAICCKAAGQAMAAANYVYAGKGQVAYALLRPPGHHAQTKTADGYCFFNNIGVALENLRAQGLKRVAVIDWDVHHGNGTQEGFYEDADVLTISLHMDHGAWGETHPQTGALDEMGRAAGLGKNLNIAMPYGSGDKAYVQVFDEIVVPAVRAHEPEIIFIAAGQDANQFDPNGRQLLSMRGFYQLGQRARSLAQECCAGKLVLVQEGGYAISYAAFCLHATLEGTMLREAELADPIGYMQDSGAGIDEFIARIKMNHVGITGESG